MQIKRESSDALFNQLTERFQFHGKNIYGSSSSENNSPLYQHLALASGSDREILALLTNADFSSQVTNLLFAAVQFLLLDGREDALREFYPNLVNNPKPIDAAFPVFRAFCLENADEIKKLVENRRVQTNEVGRCAGLLPAFELVSQRGSGKPLALLEIGASAGLLLLWDKYGYNYGNFRRTGNPDSTVQLQSRVTGFPPIPQEIPQVIERIGLEIHPIQLHNEMELRWLEALIWPEHGDRQKLLKEALRLARQHPPKIIGGNATETLAAILEEMPLNATLCVFHSYVFAQMPLTIREGILAQLIEYSQKRDFFRVSQEWMAGWEKPRIELFSYQRGKMESELLGYSESHGRWIEWL